jgi:hypothetical protein
MPEQTEHSDVRFDATDVRFGPTVAVVVAVAASLLIAGGLAAWLFNAEKSHLKSTISDNAAPSFKLPAEPRLEPLAAHSPDSGPSFLTQQQAQEAALHRFGKTGEPDFVRVPIETAIDHLAQELRSGAAPAERSGKSRGLVNGGEANSGRLLRKAAP